MDSRHLGWVRPVLVLGVLVAFAAAMLISPASAHITTFGHLKSHVKKIAKKVANQRINALAPGLSVANAATVDGVQVGGVVTADSGQTKTLAELNGFRWELRCDATETALDVTNVTGGNDSHLDDNLIGPEDNDFDQGETVEVYGESADNSMENGAVAIFGTNGNTSQYALYALLDRPVSGFGGADCVVSLNLLVG